MSDLQRFLRISEVEAVTGLKKSAIYDRISKAEFPRPVPLGDAPNSPVGFLAQEVASWQAARIAKRAEKSAA